MLEGWKKGASQTEQAAAEERKVVEHPAHYTAGKIEVWDFIADQKLDFLEGNVIKYVCRHRRKNGLEDLLKARQYLEKLILVHGGKARPTQARF